MIAVSNSSPLIAHDFLDRLDLFGDLYGDVWIARSGHGSPAASAAAISSRARSLTTGRSRNSASSARRWRKRNVGSRNRNCGGFGVTLDDQAARRLALVLGLKTSGTIGVLIQAKRRGLIPTVQPLLETLQRLPFHTSTTLYEEALGLAGELPEH